LKKPVKEYFTSYNLMFEDWWTVRKSKGLSTKAYNFKDTTGLEDSLKTHPDCAVRFAANKQFTDASLKLTTIPRSVKEKANKILI